MVKGKGDPMVRAQGRTKPDREWYPEDFDRYLKWTASILIIMSLAMRSAGVDYRMYDLILGTIGCALWLWVSVIWRDRALIILNAISLFMLASTVMREM